MKKLLVLAFASALILSGSLIAQDSMGNNSMKSDSMGKTTHVMGKISDDGKTFVADKDGKSWTINNPDAIKGHEGHHVVLTAHVDADKGEVHVVSLKMAKDSGMKSSM